MVNYKFKKNVLLILPTALDNSIVNITELIEKIKPDDHVMIWQPFEETDHRFLEYLEHDYDENPNHHENIQKFEDVLTKNNIRCFLLVGCDKNDAYKNLDIKPIKNFDVLFWPTALLHYTYYGIVGAYGDTPKNLFNPNRDFKQLYMNLNNKDRNHRCMFMDYLCKFDLFEKGVNTWRFENSTWDFKYFKPRNLRIDDYSDKEYIHEVYSKNLLRIDSVIDTVTETFPYNRKGVEYIFHTEKTYRTILLGKPFIILGAKNQHRSLFKIGFQKFDYILNYDFDEYENIQTRCLGIIDNLYGLKDRNYNEMFESVRSSVESNIDIATNIVYNDNNIPDMLKTLIKENMYEYHHNLRDFNSIMSGTLNQDEKWYLTHNIFKEIYL